MDPEAIMAIAGGGGAPAPTPGPSQGSQSKNAQPSSQRITVTAWIVFAWLLLGGTAILFAHWGRPKG